MEEHHFYIAAKSVGALICIVTLNALVLLAYFDTGTDVPRWSIYILWLLIGALLGLDHILDILPGEWSKND